MNDEHTDSPELENISTFLKNVTNSGLDKMVNDTSDFFKPKSFQDIMGIPIPPEMIPISSDRLHIDDEVTEWLQTMQEMINTPDYAVEIPFCLIGSEHKLSGFRRLFTNFSQLEKKEASVDANLLGNAIKEVGGSNNLNTLVSCHTHPNFPDDEIEDTLSSKIPQEIKDRYNIHRTGLNVSLGDLYQLQRLLDQIGERVRVMLGVLHYDGNLTLVELKDGKFQRVAAVKSS